MQCDENPTNALAILNFLAHADITAKDLWSSQIADALPPFCQVCHCLDMLVLDHANWVCQTSSGCRQDPLDSQSRHGIVRQSLLASCRMLQMLDKVCTYGIFSMSSISDMAMPHDILGRNPPATCWASAIARQARQTSLPSSFIASTITSTSGGQALKSEEMMPTA